MLVWCDCYIKIATKKSGFYGIAFDGKGEWIFGNDYATNVVSLVVDNSSSSHADPCQNNFLMLGKRDTFDINGKFGGQWRKFTINFSKAKTKFCLSLHYNGDNSYLFVNGKEPLKFKAHNGNINFPTWFCLGSISNEFGANESREVSSGGYLYNFSVDYNAIDISDILNIHKYLMVKNKIK